MRDEEGNSTQRITPKSLSLLIIVVIILVATIYYYFNAGSVKLVEEVKNAPTTMYAGESMTIIFNVSKVKHGDSTPVAGVKYSFRIEPHAGKVLLQPKEGVTDDEGNIEITISTAEEFEGHRALWATSMKRGLEKSVMRFEIEKPN